MDVQDILVSLPIPLAIISPSEDSFVVQSVNHQFRDKYLFSETGVNVVRFFEDCDRDIISSLERCNKNGRIDIISVKSPNYLPSKSEINNPLEVQHHPVSDGQGNIKHIIHTVIQTTKNKTSNSNQKLQVTVDALPKKSKYIYAINEFTTALLSTEKWDSVLSKSFSIIGESADVDRVYFFENYYDNHGNGYSNQKIEWSSETTTPQIDNPVLQNIPLEIFADFIEPLEKRQPYQAIVEDLPAGLTKETLSSQNIKSILVLPIFVNNNFHGFIGFDDCRIKRNWNNVELAFLTAITSILSAAIENKIAEKKLIQNQKAINSLVRNIPGVAYRCLCDNNWTMLLISNEIQRMAGYAPSDFINNNVRSFASIIHPDDLAQTFDIINELEARRPFKLEYRIVCKDGTIKWVKENGRGIYDDDGKLEFVDGVIIDVTDNIQKEESLRESNERYNLVLKAAQVAIVDWDIINNKTIWGEAFQHIYGYTIDENENYLWSKNIHPEDRATILNTLQKVIDMPFQNNFSAKFKFLKANGEIAYVQHKGLIVRDNRGKAIRAIGSMIDITELINQQQEIEEQNKRLREIAWIQSHVVRAPLARILGLIELFKHRESIDIDLNEIIDNLLDNAKELDGTIHDIVKTSEGKYLR